MGESTSSIGFNLKCCVLTCISNSLMQWDESAGVCGSQTWSAVQCWLVRDTEFSEVLANHLRLDFHDIEHLAVVHCNDGTNHLWEDGEIPEVCLDSGGLV
jgi:hypothetical protein